MRVDHIINSSTVPRNEKAWAYKSLLVNQHQGEDARWRNLISNIIIKSISPCRRVSFHLIKNKFHLECFLPNCDEISQVVKGKKLEISKSVIRKAHLNFQLRWSKWIMIEFEIYVGTLHTFEIMHDRHIFDPQYYVVCFNKGHYSALSNSSSRSGTSLWTRIPRFIFAGSKAQLEIPMNATCKWQRFMMNKPFLFLNHWLTWFQIPTFLCSSGVSSPWQPSSNSGCNV